MRVFTFMPRFWDQLRAREKRQTCRKRALCKPGDMLSLRGWSGRPYMTPQITLLEPVVCQRVEPVQIAFSESGRELEITVAGLLLTHAGQLCFARADGFEGREDMRAFFGERYPRMVKRAEMFCGEVVYW